MDISEAKVRAALRLRRLTQAELAQRLGITYPKLRNILGGATRPPEGFVASVEALLGMKVRL